MSKNHKAHQSDRKKSTPLELGAISLNKRKRIDITAYQEQNPGKKFCVINDADGDLQKYIDAGFSPVKSSNRTSREFKGITDRKDDEWAMWVVGEKAGGQPMHAYLLMIDEDVYDDIIINPQKKRNLDIRTAMGLAGRKGEADASARDGATVETYAPNLPTGGKGFELDAPNVPKFNTLTNN